MVSDVIPHPHHQVLAVALIVKQQVSRQCLVDIRGYEDAVLLDQINGRGVGTALAVGPLPAVTQHGLLRSQSDLRREEAVGHPVGFAPGPVMRSECLSHGEPDQAGAILLSPARCRPLPELFADDAHEPGAEGISLTGVQYRLGIGCGSSEQNQ